MLKNIALFLFSLLLVAIGPGTVIAADLSYPPKNSAGHDFNHAPIGQSFTAVASNVRAGLYLADQTTYTAWLASIFPGQIAPGSYPFAVAPQVTVKIDLYQGEGIGGNLLHSTTRTLTAPFSGFVDVDYAASGISLTVGDKYTLLLSDVSGQTYPQGVTGWVVPGVTDLTPGSGQPVTDANGNVVGYLPYGAYYAGLPVLQGALVGNDAGIGDNAFEVIDAASPPQTCSGVNAVIAAYVPRNPGYIRVANQALPLWTTNLNPTNTTFMGGLLNWYQTGLLVDYSGIADATGCLLNSLTVKPAPSALVVSAANFPDGTVGVAYSAPVTVTGGLPPYSVQVTGYPVGLSFNGIQLSGIPTASGISILTISVTDSLGTTLTTNPSLTIKPAPVTDTGNYTVKDESQGKTTALGANYLQVGAKKLIWNANTTIIVNTPSGKKSVIDGFVKIGMKVQWKGLLDKATNTVLASKLELN